VINNVLMRRKPSVRKEINMNFDQTIIFAYALFLLLGAFFGLKAGSRISLITGSVSGALIAAGGYWVGKNMHDGFLFLTVLSGFLVGAFGSRFLKTKKVMPSGMLFAVGSIFFLFCLSRVIGAAQ